MKIEKVIIDGEEYEKIKVNVNHVDLKTVNLGKKGSGENTELVYKIGFESGILDGEIIKQLSRIQGSGRTCKITIEGLKFIPPEQMSLNFDSDPDEKIVNLTTGEVIQ